MQPDSSVCVICKGSRLLCGLQQCPLLKRYYIQQSVQRKLDSIALKSSVFGPSPPNIFVGHVGYPDVRYGPMIAIGELGVRDNPSQWYGFPVDDIISFRANLFRTIRIGDVKRIDRNVEQMQEAILSTNPVDIEAKISGRPKMTVTFSEYVQPMGPSARLDRFKVVDNPKIPSAVDEAVEERMKTVDSAKFLFDKGMDIYYLTKILSAGILGVQKKLVPTRWSITATDDMIGKYLIEKIKQHPIVGCCYVGSSEYMSNHFEILLIPGNWEFENFEAWAPGTVWSAFGSQPSIIPEYESYEGRTKYAMQGGGYYASRYAAVESLDRMRVQARVVVFREIYEGYQLPLGVWVVRETALRAYNNLRKFSSLSEALQDVQSRLRVPLQTYLKMSRILSQSRLTDF
ncbi:MAG: Nre family DNA repair protein [Candidatus Micrarchaeia archaeon]